MQDSGKADFIEWYCRHSQGLKVGSNQRERRRGEQFQEAAVNNSKKLGRCDMF